MSRDAVADVLALRRWLLDTPGVGFLTAVAVALVLVGSCL